jgi:N-ethylmaleimide reductase
MTDTLLFKPSTLGALPLKNRVVMAPMTRSRATAAHVPTPAMAEYYGQRASAGLIITEGTAPSPDGAGYARIPGLWSAEQVEAWKPVTAAVHAREGKIFVQLMHTGRIGHALNLPPGAEVLAPSAVLAAGQMFTDQQGPQPHPTPRAMTTAEVQQAKGAFVTAAKNAIAAGFDGVELHGANGYLLEEFISPITNQRTDAYGGSVENRIRFVVEVAHATAEAIGGARVGIRLSPHGIASDMKPYPEVDATYLLLVKELAATGLQYVHLVDHSAMGGAKVPAELKASLRSAFPRTFILAGGFDGSTAEQALAEKRGDLIALGRPFISNPDLVTRLKKAIPLAPVDFSTAYSPGTKGYTDYPAAS